MILFMTFKPILKNRSYVDVCSIISSGKQVWAYLPLVLCLSSHYLRGRIPLCQLVLWH